MKQQPTIINNIDKLYVIASIEGKGAHVGRIKGLSYDADGIPVLEIDIDAVSCTTECYFDVHKEGNHEN